MTEHADLEALSAYVDGEAPEWAPHVGACPACRVTADQLRAVAGAVGAPVGPPPAGVRDAAIAAALGAVQPGPAAVPAAAPPAAAPQPTAPRPADARHADQRARFARRRSDWQWALPAVAALVAAVLGLSALLTTDERSTEQTTLAGPALESTPEAGALEESKAASGGAGVGVAAPPADLGDVADAATLASRVGGAGGVVSGRAGSSANPGGGGAAAPSADASTASPRAVAPNVAGTRPCEEQARSREPALREVVYFATARRGQTEAVVLGFATSSAPTPVILLMLAQDGCRELLRAAVP